MTIPSQPGLTQASREVRTFVIEAHSLDVEGEPPVGVRERYPCFDIPLAPEGTLLTPWSARDAAHWMGHWPPSGGELYTPLNIWDDEIATLWLDRHRPIEVSPWSDLIAFRQRRSPRTALEVLADLDDDELLVLTDAFLCERIRREVMPPFLKARAETIRMAAQRVAAGGMTLAAARGCLYEHDAHRNAQLRDAFVATEDWIGEWVVDLSDGLIDLYAWPTGFSVSDLVRFTRARSGS